MDLPDPCSLTKFPGKAGTVCQLPPDLIPGLHRARLSNFHLHFCRTRRDIELPEWVSGSFPGGILVLPYSNAPGNRPSKSILVNPDDGETFIIDLQEEFYHYYWRDSEHVVFFHNGDCGGLPETISDIDLFNSTLQEYSAKSHPEYILSCYFNSDDEIVRLNYEFSELAVEFVDPSGGAISFLTGPNEDKE